MSANQLTRCTDIAPLLVFYACDEVEPQEREQIDAHLANCASCAAQLREEQEMQSALVSAFQPADQLDPSGALLAQCRSELSELLDDLSAPPLQEQWSPFGWVRRWMALRPAWSAAGLVLLGLAVGTQVALWIPGREGNFGVGQAVNLLVRSLEGDAPSEPPALGTAPEIVGAQIPPDPSVDRVIRALEGLQQRDPNRYVRLRSAAALRQIGPRETQ